VAQLDRAQDVQRDSEVDTEQSHVLLRGPKVDFQAGLLLGIFLRLNVTGVHASFYMRDIRYIFCYSMKKLCLD
jgi:hypothetical protein